MGGLVIAYSGGMRVGDYVSVQNISGSVHELRKTHFVQKQKITVF
jgi:small-conductance mechanosensitive channel